jgi:hypothetical protein
MTDKAISPLRQRMIEDMTIRDMATEGCRPAALDRCVIHPAT